MSVVGREPGEAAQVGGVQPARRGAVGALRGAHAIRHDWIDTVETADGDLLAGFSPRFLSLYGDRLVTALEHERDAATAQVACLNGLLEGSADNRAARIQVP